MKLVGVVALSPTAKLPHFGTSTSYDKIEKAESFGPHND
jgi:hypothetical protein